MTIPISAITRKDLKHLEEIGHPITIPVYAKNGDQKISPTNLIVIDLSTLLDFDPIEDPNKIIERIILRIGKRQRFWTKITLRDEVFRVSDLLESYKSENHLRIAISQKINRLLKDNILRVACK